MESHSTATIMYTTGEALDEQEDPRHPFKAAFQGNYYVGSQGSTQWIYTLPNVELASTGSRVPNRLCYKLFYARITSGDLLWIIVR